MENIDIKLDYVAGRARFKALFAPFAVLPILVLLYLWAGQNNIVNFIEYKAINIYDSSFVLKLSGLEKAVQHTLLSTKNDASSNHSNVNHNNIRKSEIASSAKKVVRGYIDLIVSCTIVTFSIWVMLFISIYTLLYSLLLFMPVAALLLCTNKYPGWLYNWNKEVLSYLVRVISYFLLVSPNFPAVDDEKDITVIIPEPSSNLSRWKPLFKWLLVMPHIFILFLLFVVSLFVGFFGYIYAIITGTYPKFAFNFITKYLRWNVRVICYSTILVTDKYPPFSFK
jgi:hypothetical protein